MEDLKALSYLCHVLKIRGSDVIHPLCHVCYLGNKTLGTRYFHVNFLLSKYRSKKYLVRDIRWEKDSFTFPRNSSVEREIFNIIKIDGEQRCGIKRNGKRARIEIFVWEINRKERKIEEQPHYIHDFIRLYEVSVKSLIQHLIIYRGTEKPNHLKNHPRGHTRLMINDENASDFPMNI